MSRKSPIVASGVEAGVPWIVRHNYRGYRPVGDNQWFCGYVKLKNGPELSESTACAELDVHGGVTFFGQFGGELEGAWFLGFDCAHVGDNPITHGLEFTAQEAKRLARQVAEKYPGQVTGGAHG